MRISVSALLVLLTLVNLSDGYPSLRTIKKELQRLMFLKPPQTTTTTPLPTATLATPTAMTATTRTTPASMVAGFLGRLSYPGPSLHVLWPKKLV